MADAAIEVMAIDWITNRLPSFCIGEVNPSFFLNVQGVSPSLPFTKENKHVIYASYALCLKKLFVSFGSVSEEGASIKIDVEYYKKELSIYERYLPHDQQSGDDIINAGYWC